MATLSSDGLKIEGTVFPNPDPDGTIFNQGSTSRPFSVLKDRISAVVESKQDDATGTGTSVLCTLLYISGGSIIFATDDYNEVLTLWEGNGNGP